MNKDLLQKMVDEKYLTVTKHPSEHLYIYNYSAKAQYDKMWNEVTLMTRGLILDAEMKIVARSFGKFFNIEEHTSDEIPMLPFEAYEKLDGSLGILYWINDKPFIATRGSFESEQAKHANKILYEKYEHTFNNLQKHVTYLFEIIYPQNRIVVDYESMDDLVLLAIIDNKTGLDANLQTRIGFPVVNKFDGAKDTQQIKNMNLENKEGFVLKFENSFRVKVKFEGYVKLHKIVTGTSNIAIWEYMQEGKPIADLLEKVPDEFYEWVKNTQTEIQSKFDEILK
jgi:RNA ligase